MTGDLTSHWIYQFTFMAFFRHVTHRLLVSLSEVTERETNEEVDDNIKTAREIKTISGPPGRWL